MSLLACAGGAVIATGCEVEKTQTDSSVTYSGEVSAAEVERVGRDVCEALQDAGVERARVEVNGSDSQVLITAAVDRFCPEQRGELPDSWRPAE